MSVVVAEYTSVIFGVQNVVNKSEVVADGLARLVLPNLFANNPRTARAGD
jgi:hypothetical protein